MPRPRRLSACAAGFAAAGLLIAVGAAPAQAADPTPKPPKNLANAEVLDASCYVPPTHDPSVLVNVLRVARAHNANPKVTLAAFEAGWVESHMNNLPCGDKDSIGVFQQRPSYGWGTVEQIMDPWYAATQFVTRAIVKDRANPGATAGQLAQLVQGSAFPSRYDEAEAKARALLAEAERGTALFGGGPTDFTGDAKDDIVTFSQNAEADVYVASSTGGVFGEAKVWQQFFAPGGETPLTGDFNGDQKADIVTFAHGPEADVYVSLSNGDGFGPATVWHDFFAQRHEVPAVGDVNGDGFDDIVTFTHDADAKVFVALSNGKDGFHTATVWHDFFAPAGEFPALGDIDGDGDDDLITFTQGTTADVYAALSNGKDAFGTGQLVHDHFAPAGELPRVGDVNGDKKDDILAFTQGTESDVYVALSDGNKYGPGTRWNDFFSPTGEFPYVGDYDGDGKDDIVTFTHNTDADVYVSVSNGTNAFVDGRKWHDFFGTPGETSL
ncbi:FG-GAP repeat domain-containing protein [Streptomyces coelicoflavus]|uniref:VCBS repeat-containing protein n=1 Tax=Streptomyces coelicoflavus TaxID=285562 RepID=A0A6N9UHW1_9ACTN|nr:VCBS repeat-containing protein [Streptomyces coelicoflavus]NEB15860.1 VCBS repeat-containing protein [Streptomyces coelicoflavus]